MAPAKGSPAFPNALVAVFRQRDFRIDVRLQILFELLNVILQDAILDLKGEHRN